MMTRAQASPALYGGLFFTTLSTLMYEVLLTRIFSVTMWYHFAFVAVSVALFGMTVGALIVHLWPSGFPEERTKERLFQASLLFSLSIVASFVTQLAIPFDPKWTLVSVYSVALTYLVISVPFIFSGIAVCLALTRYPNQVSRLYAADLVGAGLGTVTLIWLLNQLEDGPSAVLAVAALAGVGACLFAYGVGQLRLTALVAVSVVFLAALGIGNAVAAQIYHPILRISWVKGIQEWTPLFEKWNSFSRIRVDGDPDRPTAPYGWGWSPTLPDGIQTRQLILNIDATASTFLPRYDGSPESVEYLRYDVVNLAHYFRPDARVFVIGSGGGRDVLAALLFDQPSVTAIELNGDILETVNGHYGEFTGHVDQQPGVTFVSDEARSYLARSDERFDIIQISLIDTWAATAAGAFALSENSLYTVEAWEIFLERLSPRGVLSVSRWFLADRPLESYRLTALAAEALRQSGVSAPRDHMMLIRNPSGLFGVAVGTILVSPEPFSRSDIVQMQRVAEELQFEVVLAPAPAESDPVFAQIAETDDLGTVPLNFPADISPPTDDRPFFFQMVRFQDLFDSSLYGAAGEHLTKPVLVLFSLSVSVIGLTILFILFPLLLTTSRQAIQGTIPLVVFFCGIGFGFLLLEIAQLQRLIIFLGHPTYALSVVLFSLLIFSGLGSLATDRLVKSGLSAVLLLPLVALLVVLVSVGFLTPVVIDWFEGATTNIRIVTAAAILAPMGLVMGMPFPLGMKVASLRPNAPTAFFWGINGATSVCASVLAVAVAMGWGISMAYWAGSVSYAIAAAALGLVVVRGRV